MLSINKFKKNKKGISPLVATLLLIAIAVAASVITYSWVMSMVGSQSQQAQTMIRIDSAKEIKIDDPPTNDTITVVVRNTGSVSASIESISVRENAAGKLFVTTQFPSPPSIDINLTKDITWNSKDLEIVAGKSYLIRVTTTTGLSAEYTIST